MIASAFLVGCWCGVIVTIGVLALCHAASHFDPFGSELEDIRSLPEVPNA